MSCGIYSIENTDTGKLYIGSSKNIKHRIKNHFTELSKNKHHSQKLQHSYNKHGQESFIAKPVLYCSENDRYLYEQLIMDFYNSANNGYNINKKAEKGYTKPAIEINNEYFLSRVKVNENGCWIFTGGLAGNGMAKVKRAGKFVSFQRLSYEHYVGAIPENHYVYRTCKDRACINPEHLKTGTKSDITKNMFNTGYAHPRGNVKLTEEQVIEIKKSTKSVKELSNLFKVNDGTIRKVLTGKTWKQI
jgi:group I intron endonuclease